MKTAVHADDPVVGVRMISIRKYLERESAAGGECSDSTSNWIAAYCGALDAFAQAGTEACPAVSEEFEATLGQLCEQLGSTTGLDPVPSASHPALVNERVRSELTAWGHKAAGHFSKTTTEIKQMLLAMMRTAERVSERDRRCAVRMENLTTKLRAAASLEDLAEMRQSIEQSAREITDSMKRMAEEGKAVLQGMQEKIAEFQARLEESEQAASVDALTHLHTRMWMEAQLGARVAAQRSFCVALLDLDGFKFVNDRFGHVAGDELLRLFAAELRGACRSTDVVGRWGGDEFLILLDGSIEQAEAQIRRVRAWVCGSYELTRQHVKLQVDVSIGLAAFRTGNTLEELLDQADAAMYAEKASRR